MIRFVAVFGVCALLAGSVHAAPKPVTVVVRVDSENPGFEGYRALDGNGRTMWHTDFQYRETSPPHEITLDLGESYEIRGFSYLPRTGGGNGTINRFECYVSDSEKKMGRAVASGEFAVRDGENVIQFPTPVHGRYFRLRALDEVANRPWTSIAELQPLVDGVTFRGKPGSESSLVREDGTPMSETEIQYVVLKHDLRNRAHFARVAPETLHPESLIQDADRDPLDIVLRRTAALLADIQAMPEAPDLSDATGCLEDLVATAEQVSVADEESRRKLYDQACKLRRSIAFSNPLLDFDELLFIKRRRALFNHMCDQYYGMAAAPGGGLYVLSQPFDADSEAAPRIRDVLANSIVQNGRLAGQRLSGGPSDVQPSVSFDGNGNRRGEDLGGGTFLSPDLSYDGKTILFAYVENQGDMLHRHHVDPEQGHWYEGRCYHIFKVNADGSELQQLTDGTWNDFDPCWLPNDRIAFISERRGGYLRCGRVCPTYTLYDMASDGSDIQCLSFHETNEWQPAVTNEGMIIWTRWDYVDRHGCTAHMPWLTTIDGCDPRPVHGNYAPRKSRPDMELDCRSIPDSHKIVAVAAPHHGQAYGSLIMIDPHEPDDDGMRPVRRITPEIGFPESQGGTQSYGTPWPLNERFFLCVYDAAMQPGVGMQGKGYKGGDYGIYLVDIYGNKELIYRDPEIACLSPIPLRSQPKPPISPELAVRGPGTDPVTRAEQMAGVDPPTGTISVMNVYDSLKPWPEDAVITHLRVLQVVPMSVPSGGLRPHETALRVASAGDSVVPCRYVLGTVPVESDGSAYFTAPANREIFFQALDENGLAIQSMRSATYVRQGESLTCAGCHEPKYRTAQTPAVTSLALQRPPSVLTPDVDGSNPFSYPRLVQPVLDRKCVACHAEKADKAPNLAKEPITGNFYASYQSLARDYAFHNYGDSYRTTPGEFGAKASKLYRLLQEGHHDVELTDEEMHRLTLWLDCTSMFYGVYERDGGLAQLRGEIAHPTLE